METNNSTMETAQQAFRHYNHGLATAEWEPFLEMLTEDFTFWFPVGPYQGLNVGKVKAAAFFQYVSRAFREGLALKLEHVTSSDTTVVFEVKSEGQLWRKPYQNQAAISFDIRGDRVCGYREYLGVVFQLSAE